MEKVFYSLALAIIALATSTSCSSTKTAAEAETDSLGIDWDSTCAPLPIYNAEICDKETYEPTEHFIIHVMQDQNDSAFIAPVASTYHTLYTECKKLMIKYDAIQNGPEFGSCIDGQYSKYMKGYRYDLLQETEFDEGNGFAFNDAFLKNNKMLNVKALGSGDPMPSALEDTLVARYGMKVRRSELLAEAKEADIAVYAVMMEPKDKKALGMHVITVGDSIYVHEEWANVDEEGYFSWHVDDDGEYSGGVVSAISKGEKGYDVFIVTLSPESTNYTALLLRDGKVNVEDIASYYNNHDYAPSPEATTLPAGSELKAELDGYKVWIHTDDPGDEDGFNAVYSVYYSKPGSKDVYHLVTAGKDPNALNDYSNQEGAVIYVDPNALITAQRAFIVKSKEGTYKLILQGCPDGRNEYCFAISLPVGSLSKMYAWVRCFEGFEGYDEATNTLKFFGYGYHDGGGRYSIREYFSFDDMKKVNEEILEE